MDGKCLCGAGCSHLRRSKSNVMRRWVDKRWQGPACRAHHRSGGPDIIDSNCLYADPEQIKMFIVASWVLKLSSTKLAGAGEVSTPDHNK